MSLRLEYQPKTTALSASNTSTEFNCGGASHLRLHAVSSTSLVSTLDASVDGSNYVDHPEIADWSPTTGTTIMLYVGGFEKVKISRTSGSATVTGLPVFLGGK